VQEPCRQENPDQSAAEARRFVAGGKWDNQLRLILSIFVAPHFWQASVSSSNSLTNKIGLIWIMTISVPQTGHVDEAPASGGVS
jgi:hypothetical protein